MVSLSPLWYLAELDNWRKREKRETKEGINERGCINEIKYKRFSFVVSVNMKLWRNVITSRKKPRELSVGHIM